MINTDYTTYEYLLKRMSYCPESGSGGSDFEGLTMNVEFCEDNSGSSTLLPGLDVKLITAILPITYTLIDSLFFVYREKRKNNPSICF